MSRVHVVFRARPQRIGKELVVVIPRRAAAEILPGRVYEFRVAPVVPAGGGLDVYEARLLNAIRRLMARKRRPPSLREVAGRVHLRYDVLADLLRGLAARGLVEVLDPESKRALRPEEIGGLHGGMIVMPVDDADIAREGFKKAGGG